MHEGPSLNRWARASRSAFRRGAPYGPVRGRADAVTPNLDNGALARTAYKYFLLRPLPLRRYALRAVLSCAVLLCGSLALFPAAANATASQPWMNRALSADERAQLLESQLTEIEKFSLLAGQAICADGADAHLPAIPRLGVPGVSMIGAGMGITDECIRQTDAASTELPAPIAMASTWDPAAAVSDGAVIGRETREHGFNFSIGGDVNIARDPRNGRTFEAEGEDPLLAGTIVAAQLRGTQSQHVPATIKHFAMNDEEKYRYGQSSNVSERTMRELELRAFQLGIEGSNVGAVMCAYNRINGVPACQDAPLLDGVLKGEWGFKGFVMTDWGACGAPVGPYGNPIPDCSTAAAANSGLDQQEPSGTFFSPGSLLSALEDHGLAQSRIDDMVHRILRTMFAFGVFDYPAVPRPVEVGRDAAVAEQVEEKAAVLLRNVNQTLPLSSSGARSIAVLGSPAATDPVQGVWPSSAQVLPIDADTPLSALRARAHGASVRYLRGRNVRAAAALAKHSQVAIVFAQDTEAEKYNRTTLAPDGNANALIDAVSAVNRHTVVVLETGGPVTMPWIHRVAAVLEAWYPGERGGHAIAHLLFGDANPSGRLPITFPARESDLPTAGSPLKWPGTPDHIDYSEGLLVGYRWYDAKHIAPLFPFGFGLTYGGRFSYSDLRITPLIGAAPRLVHEHRGLARVTFTDTNAGDETATDVAQVYAGLPRGIGEPPHRLVGWSRVSLGPGASKTVTLTLPESALDYWNTPHGRWQIAPGAYGILVGSSSRQLPLSGILRLRRG